MRTRTPRRECALRATARRTGRQEPASARQDTKGARRIDQADISRCQSARCELNSKRSETATDQRTSYVVEQHVFGVVG